MGDGIPLMTQSLRACLSIATTLAFCCCGTVSAGQSGVLFLADAEPETHLSAMGGIFTSITPADAFSQPWMLGWTINPGVSFSQWPGMMTGSRFSSFAAIFPRLGTVTLNLNHLAYTTGDEIVEELDGSIRSVTLEQESLTSVGMGFPLSETVFAGGALKYISGTLASAYRASSIAFDLGVSYYALDDGAAGGIAVKNLGLPMKYYKTGEPLPLEVETGGSFRINRDEDHCFTAGGALSMLVLDRAPVLSLGLEYRPPLEFIAFRAGFRYAGSGLSLTTGLGLQYGGFDVSMGYRLAPGPADAGGETLRLTAGWLFGPRSDADRVFAYQERGMYYKARALQEVSPRDYYRRYLNN